MVRALLLAILPVMAGLAVMAPAAATPAKKPVDYATQVAGVWQGDVTSDARGSSHPGVTVTITRIGPNKVEIACDYARIPKVQVGLARYADSLQAVSGPVVFLILLDKDPNRLDLTIDDAALTVRR
ncbi:hypothetical protein BH10PSE13_BH10PSE13_04110 [soil metagenome]